MTTQQKSKIRSVFEVVYKIFVVGGVAGILLSIGAYKEESKQKMFQTVESRVNTENHVKKALSELEIHSLKEHIGNPDYHMSKTAKDSVYVIRKEHQEWVQKNIITVYQQKEEIKEIKQLVRAVLLEVEEIKKNTKN